MRAIKILKVSNTVIPIPFNNRMMEESSIAVTIDSPVLFSSL
jgi:hypothetical protein